MLRKKEKKAITLIIATYLQQFLSYISKNTKLKAAMETIQKQMVVANKNDHANALKKVKRLCKEFVFTVGMFKGSLAEGRKTQF